MSRRSAGWRRAQDPSRPRRLRADLLRPGRRGADGRRHRARGRAAAQGARRSGPGAADVAAAGLRRGLHLRARTRGRSHRRDREPPLGRAAEGRPDQRRRAARHERLLPGPARRADRALPRHRPHLLLMRVPLLARQALAEMLGSGGLVAVVIGSGIAAARLSPHDVGLELFENAAVTGAGLVALILAFGPASGGHFNPVISVADRIFGGIDNRQLATYLPAQLVGGVLGAVAANLMFSRSAVSISTHSRSSGGLWL